MLHDLFLSGHARFQPVEHECLGDFLRCAFRQSELHSIVVHHQDGHWKDGDRKDDMNPQRLTPTGNNSAKSINQPTE